MNLESINGSLLLAKFTLKRAIILRPADWQCPKPQKAVGNLTSNDVSKRDKVE